MTYARASPPITRLYPRSFLAARSRAVGKKPLQHAFSPSTLLRLALVLSWSCFHNLSSAFDCGTLNDLLEAFTQDGTCLTSPHIRTNPGALKTLHSSDREVFCPSEGPPLQLHQTTICPLSEYPRLSAQVSRTPRVWFLTSNKVPVVLNGARGFTVEELSQSGDVCLYITSRISAVPPDRKTFEVPKPTLPNGPTLSIIF